jgi:triacylglycerol lipase
VARTLRARGLIFDPIIYASFGTSVEKVADTLVSEVGQMLSQTGADKVHLVGHSLGGVRSQRPSQVVVWPVSSTQSSPRGAVRGFAVAHLLPFAAVTRALRGGSPLLQRLASAPVPEDVRWLALPRNLT